MSSKESLPPYGTSLFPTIWQQDRTSLLWKCTTITATTIAVVSYPFSHIFLMKYCGLDGNWDNYHNITTNPLPSGKTQTTSWIEVMFRIIEQTMGLSTRVARNVLIITIGLYMLLIAGDYWSGRRQIWPKRWEVGNMQCYEEMFVEPTRTGRLLRRPGNTLSNFVYFYSAVCILLSVLQSFVNPVIDNTFILADGLFGIMLLILSLASTVWHGSNAPNSHYVDLWSMDCSIAFLSIRVLSLGFGCFFIQTLRTNASTAKFLASWICTGLYLSIILFRAKNYHECWEKRWLHGRSPISSRAMLSKRSDFYGRGHFDVGVYIVCLYLWVPQFAQFIPMLVQYLYVGSVGSIIALRAVQVSFIIGWYYRISERFLLDGCILMNMIGRLRPSLLRTVLAALFSPTSVLHFFTGVTLLMAYTHARSVEEHAL